MTITNFFRINTSGVHQAAFILALTSIANAFFALYRDRLLAGSLGASRSLDIYYASFKVPDIIFSLSLFFAASTAFIPLFLEHRNKSKESARDFFDSVLTVFFISIAFLILISVLLLPFIIPALVPGFSASEQESTLKLAYILMLSPFLLGLSGLVSGVVQSSKKFLSYAMAPIAYNGGIIVGVLYLYPVYGLKGIAYGVVAGALLHLSVQIPTLVRLQALPRLRIVPSAHPLKIVKYSFPRATALSVNQLTLILLTALASTLGAGAIAIFNLSHNLFTLPLTVIGLSYSIAAFPTMAELAIKKDKKIFFEHLLSATRHILFWTIPITGLFLVFRAHIVRLVLGTGAFAWVDTHLTIAALFLFSFAIMAQSLVTLFVRAFYALGRTREPIYYNVIAAITTIGFAFVVSAFIQKGFFSDEFLASIFRIRLDQVNPADIAFLALPLAFSIGSLINAFLLGGTLFALNGKRTRRELLKSAGKIVVVTVGMSVGAYATRQALGPYFSLDTVAQLLIHGTLSMGVALLIGYYLFEQLQVQEFSEVKNAIRARISGKDVLQPEVEHL
jgi:putative peptidoglycan lipid II flippase